MNLINEKMKKYSIGTTVLLRCSDELDKAYFGKLGKNTSGQLCIICDDGCYYYPDDTDEVRFIVDYDKLMNL